MIQESIESDPIDYTYDHWAIGGIGGTNWDNNETRTLEMEKEVFAKMAEFADPKKNVVLNGTVSETAFYAVLKAFNSINENNGNTSEFGDDKGNPLTGSGKPIAASQKIKLLEGVLHNLGFNINLTDNITPAGKLTFMGYDSTLGREYRVDNLCIKAMPLKQMDYPGTILPTTCLN